MAYTVISLFPQTVNSEEIRTKLNDLGVKDEDIIISKSNVTDEDSANHYEDDEKTKSFWDHLFVNDDELLYAYKTKSVGNVNIVVYADDYEQAQNAKKLLNDNGAIEVYKKREENQVKESDTAGLPEDVYNGIIAKARHNVYFLNPNRVYTPNSKGMDRRMDDLGSKD
ncbi:hypothetical protein [Chryseobacterium oryzae]|uniref:General stress protein 17M-like domain-containing protein n=1 Tax=Chryseobacterium oryzae TaxID=2929799 RepID=A0ABY4BJT7_9FLAO|nr:hypothetical protein [Chryseobacterium oryzae]UOE37981.1 hypothetical protein MTP08_13140 [Chryseobacterium oryzae]